jgi:Methylase of chemotaxis methyl-accepting proteins
VKECAEDTVPSGAQQGLNDFGRRGWGGPCPPRGRGAHRYIFTLLVLSRLLNLPDGDGGPGPRHRRGRRARRGPADRDVRALTARADGLGGALGTGSPGAGLDLDARPDEPARLSHSIAGGYLCAPRARASLNVTSFFRDGEHGEFLARKVVPRRVAEAGRPVPVWSAGCASGEEPETLAIVMAEATGPPPLAGRVEIEATDLVEPDLDRVDRIASPAPSATGVDPELAGGARVARPAGRLAARVVRSGVPPVPSGAILCLVVSATNESQISAATLARWLRRQLAQPTPIREHLEAAVANGDPAELRRLLGGSPFSHAQLRYVEGLVRRWERALASGD